MTGYLLLLLLVALSLGAMRLIGVRGPLLMLAAAALLFGSAGYALQGRPGLPGSAPRPAAESAPLPLANARHAFFGRFNRSDRWLIISDSYASRGDTANAVGIIRAGLRAHPDDFMLWVGLGNALTDHARVITPAAGLAFDRAEQLAPWSPAPRFFRGLAFLRSSDPQAALKEWRSLLADAPAEARWRSIVEDGIALIERGPAEAAR